MSLRARSTSPSRIAVRIPVKYDKEMSQSQEHMANLLCRFTASASLFESKAPTADRPFNNSRERLSFFTSSVNARAVSTYPS